jgi:hypothetical protein
MQGSGAWAGPSSAHRSRGLWSLTSANQLPLTATRSERGDGIL